MFRTHKRVWTLLTVILTVLAMTAVLAVGASAAEQNYQFAVSTNDDGNVVIEVQLKGTKINGTCSSVLQFDKSKMSLPVSGIDKVSTSLTPATSSAIVLEDGWAAADGSVSILYYAEDDTYGYINFIIAPEDSFTAEDFETVATITLTVAEGKTVENADVGKVSDYNALGINKPGVVTLDGEVASADAAVTYNLGLKIPANYSGNWTDGNATWTLSQGGKLTVTSTNSGELGYLNEEEDEWYSIFDVEAIAKYESLINELEVVGAETLLPGSLRGCQTVTKVTLDKTITRIDSDVFADCPIVEFNVSDAPLNTVKADIKEAITNHALDFGACFYTTACEANEAGYKAYVQDILDGIAEELGENYAEYSIIIVNAYTHGKLSFIYAECDVIIPDTIYTDKAGNKYTLTLGGEKDENGKMQYTDENTLAVTGNGASIDGSLASIDAFVPYYAFVNKVDLSGAENVCVIPADAFVGFDEFTLTLPENYETNLFDYINESLAETNGKRARNLTFAYYFDSDDHFADPLALITAMKETGNYDKLFSAMRYNYTFSWDNKEHYTVMPFVFWYWHDVNMDGAVNNTDLSEMLNILFTKYAETNLEPSDDERFNNYSIADENNDGFIDAFDLAVLLNALKSNA